MGIGLGAAGGAGHPLHTAHTIGAGNKTRASETILGLPDTEPRTSRAPAATNNVSRIKPRTSSMPCQSWSFGFADMPLSFGNASNHVS